MVRSPMTALLAAALVLSWSWSAAADDDDDDDGGRRFDRAPITDLFAFGDSLTDTGNLFALTGGVAPQSPPYFNGRYSDGPVWVETLGPLLGLEVDFATNVAFDRLANNQAVAGAFTDTRNVDPRLAGTGILSQIAGFEAAGGAFGRGDLVIVWGGANNYIFDPMSDPDLVVADLMMAVERLSDLGARRFLLPNLPDLGRTPLGTGSGPGAGTFLTAQSQAHNAALASEAAELADEEDLTILVLDIERALDTLLDAGTVFANVMVPCLIQQDVGPIIDTGACAGPLPASFDAGGNGGSLFWDLIHPTSNAHALIAFQAYGVVSGAMQGNAVERDIWAWR